MFSSRYNEDGDVAVEFPLKGCVVLRIEEIHYNALYIVTCGDIGFIVVERERERGGEFIAGEGHCATFTSFVCV